MLQAQVYQRDQTVSLVHACNGFFHCQHGIYPIRGSAAGLRLAFAVIQANHMFGLGKE